MLLIRKATFQLSAAARCFFTASQARFSINFLGFILECLLQAFSNFETGGSFFPLFKYFEFCQVLSCQLQLVALISVLRYVGRCLP